MAEILIRIYTLIIRIIHMVFIYPHHAYLPYPHGLFYPYRVCLSYPYGLCHFRYRVLIALYDLETLKRASAF